MANKIKQNNKSYTDCVSLVKWKDNKVVSVASNKARAKPLKYARRWDRITKKGCGNSSTKFHQFVQQAHGRR